jgi:hypothetical protein
MMKASVTRAGGLGVRIVTAKMAASPKRQPPRSTDEHDDEAPDNQAAPPPGMGKLVDRQA